MQAAKERTLADRFSFDPRFPKTVVGSAGLFAPSWFQDDDAQDGDIHYGDIHNGDRPIPFRSEHDAQLSRIHATDFG